MSLLNFLLGKRFELPLPGIVDGFGQDARAVLGGVEAHRVLHFMNDSGRR